MLEGHHYISGSKAESALIALEAGIDVELPNTDCYGEALREAVESGYVSMDLIDRAVGRVLAQKFSLGIFEEPYVDASVVAFDTPDDRAVARELAQKSIVLLRNEGGLLPLSKSLSSLAVIGPNADTVRNLFGDYTYPAHIETLIESHVQSAMGLPAPEGVTVKTLDDFIPAVSICAASKTPSATRPRSRMPRAVMSSANRAMALTLP